MASNERSETVKKRLGQAEFEAQMLGLEGDLDALADTAKEGEQAPGGNQLEPPSKPTPNNRDRRASLAQAGKLDQKQVVDIKADGTAVTEAAKDNNKQVQAVGKEGSACCSIF